MLNQKDLEYLAELSRMELKPAESKKLLADLEKIIGYFKTLQSLPTENVAPLTGGTALENIFRVDDVGDAGLPKEEAVGQFPEKKDGFLKIPPVFE